VVDVLAPADPIGPAWTPADGLADARALVFEYLASTEGEAGRAVPLSEAELPEILRRDCADPHATFLALLVAYVDGEPAGCVGVTAAPLPAAAKHASRTSGTAAKPPSRTSGGVLERQRYSARKLAEVARLYVRSAYRRTGLGRALMTTAHDLARSRAEAATVLSVLPNRLAAINLCESLGYRPTAAFTSYPLVHLRRVCR
jgi:ribosomal protein S18 acetylase RimI-like enzyme